ncbi:hypothetical protein JT358_04020 [Micrococcales bacterium 31B]|nr:hypothetical protein [Micrococcales bacterium 31B]
MQESRGQRPRLMTVEGAGPHTGAGVAAGRRAAGSAIAVALTVTLGLTLAACGSNAIVEPPAVGTTSQNWTTGTGVVTSESATTAPASETTAPVATAATSEPTETTEPATEPPTSTAPADPTTSPAAPPATAGGTGVVGTDDKGTETAGDAASGGTDVIPARAPTQTPTVSPPSGSAEALGTYLGLTVSLSGGTPVLGGAFPAQATDGSSSTILKQGTGATVAENEEVVLVTAAFDASTGKQLHSNFGSADEVSIQFNRDYLPPEIYSSVKDAKHGVIAAYYSPANEMGPASIVIYQIQRPAS